MHRSAELPHRSDLRTFARGLLVLASFCLVLAPAADSVLAQDSGVERLERPQDSGSDTPPAPDGANEGSPEDEPEVDPLDAELDRLDAQGLGGMERIPELTREIRDNMKRIAELLDRRDTGEQTQQTQARTIEQIDELIELIESAAQQSSSSSSGGSSSSSSGGQSSQQQEQDQQRSSRQERMSQQQQQQGSEQSSSQQEQQQQSGQNPQDNPQQSRNDQTSTGELPPEGEGELQDREGRGRWGRLPKTEIEKMYDNGRRKLPEKYRILLEDYFRRLPTGD